MTPTIQHRDRIRAFASVHWKLRWWRMHHERGCAGITTARGCEWCVLNLSIDISEESTRYANSASALLRVGLTGRQ